MSATEADRAAAVADWSTHPRKSAMKRYLLVGMREVGGVAGIGREEIILKRKEPENEDNKERIAEKEWKGKSEGGRGGSAVLKGRGLEGVQRSLNGASRAA